MDSNLEISASPSACKTITHLVSGDIVKHEGVVTLVVSSPYREVVESIVSVSVGDYHARITTSDSLIHYRDRHADPFFTFFDDGRYCKEVTLYEPYLITNYGGLIELVFENGSLERLPVRLPLKESASEMPRVVESELLYDGSGISLEIVSGVAFTLIRQEKDAAGFKELSVEYSPGRHVIPVPPSYSHYLGYCISLTAGEVDYEIKHAIMGKLGHATGRWFLPPSSDSPVPPPISLKYRYRALTALVWSSQDHEGLKRHVMDFDEVVVYVGEEFANAHPELLENTSTTKWVMVGPSIEEGIRIVSTASDIVPGINNIEYSFFLSGTVSLAETSERLNEAVLACNDRGLRDTRVLERLWLDATSVRRNNRTPGFGIGFMTPHSDNEGSLWRQEFKRKLTPSSPCYQCDVAADCDILMPTPIPYALSKEAPNCPIKKSIKKV